MTIDIFSIPAISSVAESVLSGTKHTRSDERASLEMTTIEALECLKPWFRASLSTNDELSQTIAQELASA